MKYLDEMDDTLDVGVALHDTKFHEESIGSQNEFFDDHQKWMIDSFDSL